MDRIRGYGPHDKGSNPLRGTWLKNYYVRSQAQIAEKQGIEEIFTIVTKKTVTLDYHDVVKRKSDNAIFRVTSRGIDSAAPTESTVPIVKVSAERWVLPT